MHGALLAQNQTQKTLLLAVCALYLRAKINQWENIFNSVALRVRLTAAINGSLCKNTKAVFPRT